MLKKNVSKEVVALSISCISLTAILTTSTHAVERTSHNPVLIELFTSEGCSSCPPAEKLVKQIKQEMGDNVIILSEHVDYWNHLGWKDPFSSKTFTNRQYNYAKHFGRSGVYTPQVVVNGKTQAVGSNRRALLSAIKNGKTKAQGKLTQSIRKPRGTNALKTNLVFHNIDEKQYREPVNVTAALVKKEASTNVKRGENFGRKLSHSNVVVELKSLTNTKIGKGISKSITFDTIPKGRLDSYSVVAFVQGAKSGRVYLANKQSID